MKPCLSQTCTMPNSFMDDIEAYSTAGVSAVEVWLTKLEQAVASQAPAELKRRVADKGIDLVAASYQGGLLLSQGEARRAHFDHFKRRLDLCQQFGIGTLVVAPDFTGEFDSIDLERAVVSLKQAAQWAAGFDVRLALEFRGNGSFCTNIDTTLALVEHAGESNLGICLDVFHYYKGPSKFDDLVRLHSTNLALVQLCDVAGVPRELMTDSDRILPGEGDFLLEAIVDQLRQSGYNGWVSLELMNPVLWQGNSKQVAELGWSALRRTLGIAPV